MKAIISARQLKTEGAQLEESGDLEGAAARYREIVNRDHLDDEAVSRLLIVYRKLRNYREELSVIDAVLAAYEEQDKLRREKWVREHSKAAAAGTAIFQQLGGSRVSGFGADRQVAVLMKRRKTVMRKLSGKKGGQRQKQHPVKAAPGRARRHTKGRAVAGEARKRGKQAERGALKDRKREARGHGEAAAARKAAAEELKQLEAAKKKAEAARPSLFVIVQTYQAPIEEIEAATPARITFLDQHYRRGDFLFSGSREDRPGGIIIARGKTRTGVDHIMRSDPFVKKGLSAVEILEFKVSQAGPGLTAHRPKP
ncbi:MAG TPA: YciI family protein [Puia sp.]|nr:YciI family protein [Puia sp.]